MADIRFKDLTTTASSTASDDFFAADGATNGTRKLSAYSPSFGGNATVGGTLTVSGTQFKLNGLFLAVGDGTTSYLYSQGSGGFIFRNAADTSDIFRITNAGVTTVTNTTASTSTSSGALVVSGGVGVAGAINAGDQIKVTNATIPDLWLQNTSGATSAYRNILIRQNSDNTFKFLSTSDAGVLTKDNIITGSNDTGAIGIGVAPSSGTSSLTVAGTVIASASSNAFRITTAQTPASASATGTAGTIAWDTSYIYVCTATNTWKRVAISTW